MDYSTAMTNLREMFPHHPVALIERVLRENRGALNPTASQLLQIPVTGPTPEPPSRKPAPARAPPPARPPPPDHIFPPDFLRLPADVEWVRVSADTNTSPLQTDDDIIGGMAVLDHRRADPMPDGGLQELETGTFDAPGQESGWSKLKSKLLGLSPSYSQL
jgi:hypothetical protein